MENEFCQILKNLDWSMIVNISTIIAAAFSIIGFCHGFLRNFKADMNSRFDDLDKRMDNSDKRIDNFELKITSLEERMFWMATGKRLEEAILEEHLKKEAK